MKGLIAVMTDFFAFCSEVFDAFTEDLDGQLEDEEEDAAITGSSAVNHSDSGQCSMLMMTQVSSEASFGSVCGTQIPKCD